MQWTVGSRYIIPEKYWYLFACQWRSVVIAIALIPYTSLWMEKCWMMVSISTAVKRYFCRNSIHSVAMKLDDGGCDPNNEKVYTVQQI